MGYKILGRANEVKDQAENAASNVVEETSSVVSDAIDTSKDFVNKAAKTSYKMLGEAKNFLEQVEGPVSDVVETVADTSSSVIDTVNQTSQTVGKALVDGKVSKYIKAVTSPVGLNFLNDLVFGKVNTARSNAGITKGESVLSEGGRQFVRDLVIDKGLLEKGSITIDKDIYTELQDGISINQTGGSSASEIVDVLAERNPLSEAKLILGQFNAYIDENNDIIVEDQFNYNKIIIDGVEYQTDAYEKAIKDGKFTELEVLLDTVGGIFTEGLNYEKIRAIGFLLGSRDYEEDDSRDEGRSFKMNLGPAPSKSAVKTSLRPKARPEGV